MKIKKTRENSHFGIEGDKELFIKIDYRKFNYSALIRSKQLNREEAIEKIEKII